MPRKKAHETLRYETLSQLFEAFLKCPTKCWLRANGEPASDNAYAESVEAQDRSYRARETERLLSETTKNGSTVAPPAENLKAGKWRLAIGAIVQAQVNSYVLESELHGIERRPSEGRSSLAQFIPIRFMYMNKLGADDKLLAFDAFVLSGMMADQSRQNNLWRQSRRTEIENWCFSW